MLNSTSIDRLERLDIERNGKPKNTLRKMIAPGHGFKKFQGYVKQLKDSAKYEVDEYSAREARRIKLRKALGL